MKNRIFYLLGVAVFLSVNVSAQPFAIGHRTMSFIDPARNNRAVPSEVYYPAQTAGNNTAVADSLFPVIVFGHGFLMPYSAYGYFKDAMVPDGYIVVFPTTEGGIYPNHTEYGADLAFLVTKMHAEGMDQASPFYLHVDSTSGVMGHSMGGGASFLACKNNTVPSVMVTFAAAETTPSAIAAAAGITIPNLVFSADQDCVTLPAQNQVPMYNSLASDCKVFINIKGGGHCYFADYNFTCSLGETGCQQNFTITREQQHAAILDFTKLYLDYYLKNNGASWTVFNDSLASSSRISYEKSCSTNHLEKFVKNLQCRIFPNPASDHLFIKFPGTSEKAVQLIIRSVTGGVVFMENLTGNSPDFPNSIDISTLSPGFYLLEITCPENHFFRSFIKAGPSE